MARIDLPLLECIAEQRRFESRTLEIAKRLFIHGETPKRLSIEYGVNLQRVYAIRKEILAAAQAWALPPGWEEMTIAGPSELIAQFKRQFAEALARHAAALSGERSTP
ncbi:TrfB-related DNA-binding protein [Piscinibacter sp.]|uniref:TrfB-related DNA-binding protein n=1 Tax=Piscinibacter sp. TaxID=1903157 RepID=UPI002F416033